MKQSLITKLETLAERFEEIKALLSENSIISNQSKFRELSKEYAELEPLITCFQDYSAQLNNKENLEELKKDEDKEMRIAAEEEWEEVSQRIAELEVQLQFLLLPKDPNDSKNIYLEIRAGTGGDEAAIFAGDMARMYLRYAQAQKWQSEVISESSGEKGGYKGIVIHLVGQDVYGKMKFESGTHRVQRVPETEAQGRIHTSACTVAVLPEVEIDESVTIDPSEIRVDTYRASGAGGQHVNKTDSAVRITHIPTGFVVECQDERSQHKNRAKAMSLLQSKILDAKLQKHQQEQAQTRKLLVGSGDRSERIRTYNYPQGRLTDHRINLTLYKLEDILEGHLEDVIEPLRREYQADLLANLSDAND